MPPGTIDVPVPLDSPTSFSASDGAGSSPGAAGPGSATGGSEDGTGDVGRAGTAAQGGEGSDDDRQSYLLRGPRRATLIVVSLLGALLISAVAIGILYSRWYRAEHYESTIVVWGPPDWDQAKVTVTGAALPQGRLESAVSKESDLMRRFHVPPGRYVVRVEKDGQLLAEQSGEIPPNPSGRMIWWPFKAPAAATQTKGPAVATTRGAAGAAGTRPTR